MNVIGYAIGRDGRGAPVQLKVGTEEGWFVITDHTAPTCWETIPYEVGRYSAGCMRLAYSLLAAHAGPEMALLLAERFAYEVLSRKGRGTLCIKAEDLDAWITVAAAEEYERGCLAWVGLDDPRDRRAVNGQATH